LAGGGSGRRKINGVEQSRRKQKEKDGAREGGEKEKMVTCAHNTRERQDVLENGVIS